MSPDGVTEQFPVGSGSGVWIGLFYAANAYNCSLSGAGKLLVSGSDRAPASCCRLYTHNCSSSGSWAGQAAGEATGSGGCPGVSCCRTRTIVRSRVQQGVLPRRDRGESDRDSLPPVLNAHNCSFWEVQQVLHSFLRQAVTCCRPGEYSQLFVVVFAAGAASRL